MPKGHPTFHPEISRVQQFGYALEPFFSTLAAGNRHFSALQVFDLALKALLLSLDQRLLILLYTGDVHCAQPHLPALAR